jgi:hypothetical protein
VGASAVKVAQVGSNTQITSVRVQSASGIDTTIADPLAIFRLPSILRFTPDDSVTVTATTMTSTDVVVLHLIDHRFRMHNNGDNTYTFGWHTGSVSGWRHFGVNAFTRGTLYDDMMPYDSQTWIVPFAVTTDPVVQTLP